MMAVERTHNVTLGDLIPEITHPAVRRREVLDVTLSSKHVAPGSVFFALPGQRQHGLAFADDALRAGASAVVYDPAFADELVRNGSFVAIPGLHGRLGEIADTFFSEPSQALRVVGITGTNGKTTCAHLIASALAAIDRPAGVIGTTGFGAPDSLTPSKLTTPDVFTVHRRLAALRDADLQFVAMEVSSHALTQRRVDGVRFDTALFTNLTRDHLDYHGDFERYESAKAQLFAMPGLKRAVINIDDEAGRRLLGNLEPGVDSVTVQTEAIELPRGKNRVCALKIEQNDGLEISVDSSFGSAIISSPLVGRFNASNLLMSFATLAAWGIAPDVAANAVGGVQAAPGRLERFGGTPHAEVYVDFAHTPDGLRAALTACRHRTGGKLIVVFGCGGERDSGKRGQMGRIAESLADRVVITNDNPRNEDPDAIVRGILDGISNKSNVEIECDRVKAIRGAINSAGVGDVVLIAGKGHESSQVVGKDVRPLSDRETVRDYFGELGE